MTAIRQRSTTQERINEVAPDPGKWPGPVRHRCSGAESRSAPKLVRRVGKGASRGRWPRSSPQGSLSQRGKDTLPVSNGPNSRSNARPAPPTTKGSTMSRADEIRKQIAELQAELEGLPPIDAMGARELARAAGISPATASRVKRGDVPDMATAKKLLPYLGRCPCCGQETPTN